MTENKTIGNKMWNINHFNSWHEANNKTTSGDIFQFSCYNKAATHKHTHTSFALMLLLLPLAMAFFLKYFPRLISW